MPIGGSAVSWAEGVPAGSEQIGLGDNRIRSLKTSVREGLDNEHVWPSDGSTVAVVGAHRAGSARAYHGTQSRVSSGDTNGRMMIASDTSRLFGVGSAGTVLLGAGPLSLSLGSMVGITHPQRAYVAVEVGATSSASSMHQVTFPNSGFSGIPFVMVSAATEAAGGNAPGKFVRIIGITASEFSAQVISSENGDALDTNIQWISIGTRTL